MSSANKIVKKLRLRGISLIKIKKSKGPKILPCGTPIFMVACLELVSLMATNYCLLDR